MDFQHWNDSIAAHFFRPEMAGRRVFLFITEDVLLEISKDSNGVNDFIEAVKAGPPNITRQGLCQRALQIMQDWRSKHFSFPPYIAYLALFVLSAGKEGDFAPHAYYPRLRSLLGEEPIAGQYPSFDRMVSLWDDLDRWSNKDRSGELGVFYNNLIAGNWFHVGIPIAQTLLTEHERAVLPGIFARTAMDPNAPPSDEELAALVRRFGQGELRPRTLSLLTSKIDSEEELRGVLVETIEDELRDWDGTVAVTSDSSEQGFQNGTLRLCCELDEVAATVSFTFRFNSKHDFPIDGLSLGLESNQHRYSAEEYGLGWSTPLVVEGKGERIDATHFDWSADLVTKDEERKWTVRFHGAPVRVFVSGAPDGIHGFVEVRKLPQSTRFYLAIRKDFYGAISDWGKTECEGFREIDVRGLPDGWLFCGANRAFDDADIKDRYPMLSLPVATKLSFQGGVRISRGNQFFSFAPPRIVLEGSGESIEVYCNNTRLEYRAPGDFYATPEDLPIGTQLIVEARRNGSAIRKLSFYLEDEFPAFVYEQAPQFDSFGNRILEGPSTGAIAGALVEGISLSSFDFAGTLHRSRRDSVFYVGRAPGQIVAHPDEPLPDAWSPVWQITMRRTGAVEYCGISLSNSEPMKVVQTGDHKRVQLWKELVWHRRKRITPPRTSSLKRLWRQYQDIARHV
jgi:hypothetical protein